MSNFQMYQYLRLISILSKVKQHFIRIVCFVRFRYSFHSIIFILWKSDILKKLSTSFFLSFFFYQNLFYEDFWGRIEWKKDVIIKYFFLFWTILMIKKCIISTQIIIQFFGENRKEKRRFFYKDASSLSELSMLLKKGSAFLPNHKSMTVHSDMYKKARNIILMYVWNNCLAFFCHFK